MFVAMMCCAVFHLKSEDMKSASESRKFCNGWGGGRTVNGERYQREMILNVDYHGVKDCYPHYHTMDLY